MAPGITCGGRHETLDLWIMCADRDILRRLDGVLLRPFGLDVARRVCFPCLSGCRRLLRSLAITTDQVGHRTGHSIEWRNAALNALMFRGLIRLPNKRSVPRTIFPIHRFTTTNVPISATAATPRRRKTLYEIASLRIKN